MLFLLCEKGMVKEAVGDEGDSRSFTQFGLCKLCCED